MQTEILRMVHSHFYQNQLQLIHVQAMKWTCSCPLHLYQIRQESYILLTPVSYGLVQSLWAKQCNSHIHYIHNWRTVNYKALLYNQTSLRQADHSSRGVLPTVVHRCAWSRKPQQWGGHDPRWVAAPQNIYVIYIYIHIYIYIYIYILRRIIFVNVSKSSLR